MPQKKTTGFPYAAIAVILAAGLIVVSLSQQKPQTQELKKFSSLSELEDFIKSSQQEFGYFGLRTLATTETGAAAPAQQKAEDYSTTNIQVAGVDEADIVKNDGRYIYTVAGSNVVILDAYPAESARILSIVNMSGSDVQGLYISGERLVVFANSYGDYTFPADAKPAEGVSIASPTIVRPYFPSSVVRIYDITDRSQPALKRELALNGTYFNSRMIGDHAYIIVNSPVQYYGDDIVLPVKGFPEIYYFDFPDYSYQLTTVLSVNVNQDDEEPQSKIFLLGYSSALFVSKENMYIVYPKRVRHSLLTERAVEEIILPSAPQDVADRIKEVMDSQRPFYEKQGAVAEILQEWFESLNPEDAARLAQEWEQKYSRIQAEVAKETDRSVVHKISVSNGAIEYRTRGEVPGQPLNQFSMDEHNGYFRIATTTSPAFFEPIPLIAAESIAPPMPPQRSMSANHIYVLDSNMNIVGKLEDLARGERIYSARFIGDRAYLVTFIRIDPLFVVDLSDPANPRVLGELKIPGVSDYIHPYDENHIIGVGRSAEDLGTWATFRGLKLSLFDVRDPSSPKEISKYEVGERGTDSEALRDHKAFLFSRSRNLLVLPVIVAEKDYQYSWGGAYAFDVSVENGFSLKGTVSHDEMDEAKKEFYYPRYPVRRSLYIGNTLYTISDRAVKANDLSGMSEIVSVELPQQEQYYILPAVEPAIR